MENCAIILTGTAGRDKSITVQTRKGSNIENAQTNGSLPCTYLADATKLKTKHALATFRTGPCGYYNCHGLTFASRRTRIWDPKEIKKIITEDGYVKINEAEVFPGDIIIYYTTGDPQHSGVVLNVKQERNSIMDILILSKWGHGHEVIHNKNDCPYWGLADLVEFYRIKSFHHEDAI